MRLRMGTLRRLLLAEVNRDRRETGSRDKLEVLTKEDIFGELLDPRPQVVVQKVWTPYRCRSKWVPGSNLATVAERWHQRYGTRLFTPLDAMDALQEPKDIRPERKRTGDACRIVVSEDEREKVVLELATTIAEHFMSKGIDIVIPVDSRAEHGVPQQLARLVADYLDAEFNPTLLSKITKPEELRIKTTPGVKLPPDIAKKHASLQNKLAQGKKLTSSDYRPGTDYYESLFKLNGEVARKRYLIIDDNVQSGRTFNHIEQAFRNSGVEVLYAAGYHWPTSQ
jgi:adenine/guanine phosphoribosyltransferase-like PRPP-binding protein